MLFDASPDDGGGGNALSRGQLSKVERAAEERSGGQRPRVAARGELL